MHGRCPALEEENTRAGCLSPAARLAPTPSDVAVVAYCHKVVLDARLSLMYHAVGREQ